MIGGALSAMVSILVGVFVLFSFIEQNVIDRFDATLTDRHTELVARLAANVDTPEKLNEQIYNPAYSTPYSGVYWQISAPNGDVYGSPSLLGSELAEPADRPTQVTVRSQPGPEAEPLRSIYQTITLRDGSKWGVMVAENITSLSAQRQQTARSLILAFALVGMLGLAGAFVQTASILGPLDKLRHEVARRWETGEGLSASDYPEEVAPLVDDINNLLERNRTIIASARRQAADLAHALKTPTAILRNELSLLEAQELEVEQAQDALDRVDAQLGRSLARMRAANSGAAASTRTDLSRSVQRFTRLFSTMAEKEGKRLVTDCAADLQIRIDQQDIEEVMGNLLDNALKWCQQTVALRVVSEDDAIHIHIEDDGPGIPEGSEREALRSGGRLDSSKPGTGLGLAIAIDLLDAYGASLSLEKSRTYGGLGVHITIPNGRGIGTTATLKAA